MLGGTEEALTEGGVDFVIGGIVPGGFLGEPLMQVRFVCAAAPSHPLHQLGRTLTLDDLREHRHLVVRDSGARRSRSGGWLNEQPLDRLEQGDVDPRSLHGPRLCVVSRKKASARNSTPGRSCRCRSQQGGERYVTLYLVYADRRERRVRVPVA